MQFRDADPVEDAGAISLFACTGATEGWAKDVEDAIRGCLEWCRMRPFRRAWVVEEPPDGGLIGVAVARAMYATTPNYGWVIEALGVRVDHHGAQLGQRLLADVLECIGRDHPGAIVQWLVHRENSVMCHVSECMGAANEIVEEPPAGYTSFVIRV